MRGAKLPLQPYALMTFTNITFTFTFTSSKYCILYQPIPVAARANPLVCGRSLAGIAHSNPVGGTNVCLLWVFCFVQAEVSAAG